MDEAFDALSLFLYSAEGVQLFCFSWCRLVGV